MINTENEFYIGWEKKMPSHLGKHVRRIVIGLVILAFTLAVALASLQRTIGVSTFEWGTLKEFTGTMKASPYPHLIVPRPGAAGGGSRFSTYYLVKPFKYGLDGNIVANFDGKTVTLRGTLIYRDNQTMIEAIPDSIKESQSAKTNGIADATLVSLGRQTLVGEIVDSKCYFGVMNPGQFVPHRGCAVRCISGGCPPLFVVQHEGAAPLCFLLVSADGHAVNKDVLDMVAEPLEITGEVERQDNLLILRADPKTYRRLNRARK